MKITAESLIAALSVRLPAHDVFAHKKASTDKESHTRSHELVIVILNETKNSDTLRRQQNIYDTSHKHRSSLPQTLRHWTSLFWLTVFWATRECCDKKSHVYCCWAVLIRHRSETLYFDRMAAQVLSDCATPGGRYCSLFSDFQASIHLRKTLFAAQNKAQPIPS
jgi:hypothetical protein